MSNKLWLISMPIGNDLDLTKHALMKLNEISEIWCEDTRSFKKFCERMGIDYKSKKITSFHDHSDERRIEQFLSSLENNDIGYVSEAGSPYISDPAHHIVQACIANDIEVKSASGISSVIMALELSGLPAIPFTFHGFLPRNDSGKQSVYLSCMAAGGTHLFFEGVSRALKTIDEMVKTLPAETQFAVMREMSKDYESVYRFQADEWTELKETIVEKGEFVIAFYIKEAVQRTSSHTTKILEQIKSSGAKPKLVSKLIAELTGEDVSEVYKNYIKP